MIEARARARARARVGVRASGQWPVVGIRVSVVEVSFRVSARVSAPG